MVSRLRLGYVICCIFWTHWWDLDIQDWPVPVYIPAGSLAKPRAVYTTNLRQRTILNLLISVGYVWVFMLLCSSWSM